ncbi:MAG: two-component regulator propeller domain-containing protein [Taibaiella sp.]
MALPTPFNRHYKLCLHVAAYLFSLVCHANPQVNLPVEVPFDCPVYSFEKDPKGLMWLGTKCGLRIFNGYEYQTIGTVTDSLPTTCLLTDTALHLIWVGTSKGLYTIDYITHRLQKKYSGQGVVQSILKSKKQDLVYVVYEDGTLWTIPINGPITTLKVPELANNKHLVHSHKMLVEDGRDLLFFFPEKVGTLYRLNLDNHTVKQENNLPVFLSPIHLESFGDKIILSTWGSGAKLLDRHTLQDITPTWLDSLNKIYGYNTATQCFLSGEYLYIYHLTASVWRLNMRTGAYDQFWGNSYALPMRQHENHFFVDQYLTLWVGQKFGMLRIRNDHNWFEQILDHYPGLPIRPSTRGIMEDTNGDLYVGSYSGMFYRPNKKKSWERFSELNERPVYQNDFLNDKEGDNVYAASESSFFLRFNKKKKVFENDFYQINGWARSTDNMSSYCLIKDTAGKIWVGTNEGLGSYDEKTHVLIQEKNNPFDIGKVRIIYFEQSSDKNIIWVGSEKGVYQLDIHKGVQKKFDSRSQPALSNDKVYCIKEDAKSDIWIATENGISILDKTGKHMRYINTQNSNLCNDVVYGFLWENEYTIWISTQRGLSKHNTRTGTFVNYYVEDGICNNEFNRNSLLKDHTGKMYFGGIAGITSFYPERVPELPGTVQLFISGISMWDSRTNKEQTYKGLIKSSSEIVMKQGDRSLTFSMGLSDYTAPDKNNYFYRIVGLYSDEWISLGQQHILKIESLPPGSYILELKGVSSRGITSANIFRYNLDIKRPYFQTWWFYMIIFLLATSIVYFALLVRFMNLKKLEQQRIQIASDLHDEIGSLITRITIYSSSLKEGYLDPVDKNSRLDKIINISHSLSSSIRDVLWAIDARNDMTSNLVDYMSEYAQNQIRYSGATLTFDISGVDKSLKLVAQTRQQLYRIFKEALNNILKHSKASYVKIIYTHQANGFSLHIENDGAKVLSEKKVGIGQGLRNIKMRAKTINATVHFTNSDGVFIVQITSVKKRLQIKRENGV